MILAICSPIVSRSQTPAAVESAQSIKWKLGCNDAGSSSWVLCNDRLGNDLRYGIVRLIAEDVIGVLKGRYQPWLPSD